MKRTLRDKAIEKALKKMLDLYPYDIDQCMIDRPHGCKRCRAADEGRKALAMPMEE
jgi:hypothetical protein